MSTAVVTLSADRPGSPMAAAQITKLVSDFFNSNPLATEMLVTTTWSYMDNMDGDRCCWLGRIIRSLRKTRVGPWDVWWTHELSKQSLLEAGGTWRLFTLDGEEAPFQSKVPSKKVQYFTFEVFNMLPLPRMCPIEEKEPIAVAAAKVNHPPDDRNRSDDVTSTATPVADDTPPPPPPVDIESSSPQPRAPQLSYSTAGTAASRPSDMSSTEEPPTKQPRTAEAGHFSQWRTKLVPKTDLPVVPSSRLPIDGNVVTVGDGGEFELHLESVAGGQYGGISGLTSVSGRLNRFGVERVGHLEGVIVDLVRIARGGALIANNCGDPSSELYDLVAELLTDQGRLKPSLRSGIWKNTLVNPCIIFLLDRIELDSSVRGRCVPKLFVDGLNAWLWEKKKVQYIFTRIGTLNDRMFQRRAGDVDAVFDAQLQLRNKAEVDAAVDKITKIARSCGYRRIGTTSWHCSSVALEGTHDCWDLDAPDEAPIGEQEQNKQQAEASNVHPQLVSRNAGVEHVPPTGPSSFPIGSSIRCTCGHCNLASNTMSYFSHRTRYGLRFFIEFKTDCYFKVARSMNLTEPARNHASDLMFVPKSCVIGGVSKSFLAGMGQISRAISHLLTRQIIPDPATLSQEVLHPTAGGMCSSSDVLYYIRCGGKVEYVLAALLQCAQDSCDDFLSDLDDYHPFHKLPACDRDFQWPLMYAKVFATYPLPQLVNHNSGGADDEDMEDDEEEDEEDDMDVVLQCQGFTRHGTRCQVTSDSYEGKWLKVSEPLRDGGMYCTYHEDQALDDYDSEEDEDDGYEV